MKFAESYWLILLVVIPLLHRFWMKKSTPPSVAFPMTLPKAIASNQPLRWLLLVRYAAIFMMVIGLARPQWQYSSSERRVSGIDIMLLFDVSASMNVEDLADKSRLDVAKETIERFVQGRNSDRIGLVIFSGEPLTLTPLTLDYGLLLKAIRGIEIGILKDGTAIGDGLAVAVNRLKDSTAKSKVIILTTDGDNNVGQIDPATAGELAAGYGIKVYSIAIGKEGRVKIPIKHKGMFGNEVVTYQWLDNSLNPELLQKISKNTDGRFYRVTDAGTLEKVFKEINSLEQTEIKTTEKVHYEEGFQRWVLYGLLIFLFEQFLSRFVWRLAL